MAERTHPFPRALRLSGEARFETVYNARTRESRGPLAMFSLPNDLGHPRLGISISRKAGIAVRRNRIKRLIRESMRLLQHEIPTGYDLIIVVRGHKPMPFAEYQKIMQALLLRAHQAWTTRPDSPPAAKA